MENKFPVLTLVSNILRYFGVIVTIGGLGYGLVAGVFEPMQPRHYFGPTDAIQLASGVIVGLLGLLTVAFGESISVLIAIEQNTRKN